MYKTILRIFSVVILCLPSLLSCSNDEEIGKNENLQISLNEEDVVIEIGKSTRLVAGFSPSDAQNKAHTWTSANPLVATVDETGSVSGVSVGSTIITATALANHATASCTVHVVNKIVPVTSITLNSKEETIPIGEATQLSATVLPSTATDKKVTWSSSSPEVAMVDANGLVVGASVGSANITASAGGKSAICAVTVTERQVDFSKITFRIEADRAFHISGTVTPIGVAISEIGVCLSKETTPTIETNRHILSTSDTKIDKEINGLEPNTTYYVRMYAKADNEIYYGKTEAIKVPDELTTHFKLEENYYSEFNGHKEYQLRISTPDVEGYDCSFCYGVAPHPEITDNIAQHTNGVDRTTITLKNLLGATKYYIRAYSLKGGKPIYHPGEACFSTIGEGTKLSATFLNNSHLAQPWEYKIEYTLIEKGTYKITVSSFYGAKMGKSLDDINSGLLYVTDGSGHIYLSMKHWANYGKWSGASTITFENIDTGTYYKIQVGDQN